MGRPKFIPKTAPSLRRSPPPSNTPIPRPTLLPPKTASGSNQPFCHSSLLRTDRWDKRTFCTISAPLAMLIESDALLLILDAVLLGSHTYSVLCENLLFRSPRLSSVCRLSVCLSRGISKKNYARYARNFITLIRNRGRRARI